MFDVMALDRPGDNNWKKIGEFYNETPFIKSLYGDERLFFQHQGANLDLDWWTAHDPDFSKDKRNVMREAMKDVVKNAPAWLDDDGNSVF